MNVGSDVVYSVAGGRKDSFPQNDRLTRKDNTDGNATPQTRKPRRPDCAN